MAHTLPTPSPDTKLLCVDYFDTLVSRSMHPEDVKRQWAHKLAHLLGSPISGQQVYATRARIEIELCHRNKAAGHDLEFSVLDCYASIFDELHQLGIESTMDEVSFSALCLELELSCECASQTLDTELIQWLKAHCAGNLPIVLISDFYIPAHAFSRMLRFHEIDGLFQRIYVSADSLLTKKTGRAFSRVLAEMGVSAHQVLMIGDNMEADYKQPLANGMQAIHIDRSVRHEKYGALATASANKQELGRLVAEHLSAHPNEPFPEITLSLFHFVEKLHASLVQKKARDVFFLAREGQLLKQLFDRYQDRRRLTNELKINTHYLEVSRRATFLPSLAALPDENFEMLFRQYRRISAAEFLMSLGLETLLPTLERTLHEFDFSERQEDFPTSRVFDALLGCRQFHESYEAERVSRRNAFLAYLDDFRRDEVSDEVHLVDVGWKGTIQDNLYRIFQQAELDTGRTMPKLSGLYMGLVAAGNIGPRNRKSGLLFSMLDPWTPATPIFNENRALFEVILAADHGSAASYRRIEGAGIEVVRGEFEEKQLFLSIIQPLQQRILIRFDQLNELLACHYYEEQWLANLAAKHHARMVFQPSAVEITWFSNIFHVENFGVFERSGFDRQNTKQGLVAKLRFMTMLWRSRGRMELGFWPWLSCLQNGGRMAAWGYRMYRLNELPAAAKYILRVQ